MEVGDEARLRVGKSVAWCKGSSWSNAPFRYAVAEEEAGDDEDDDGADQAGQVGDDKPVPGAKSVAGENHQSRVERQGGDGRQEYEKGKDRLTHVSHLAELGAQAVKRCGQPQIYRSFPKRRASASLRQTRKEPGQADARATAQNSPANSSPL